MRAIVSKHDVVMSTADSREAVGDLKVVAADERHRDVTRRKPDEYTTRVMKYIPGETVAVFMACDSIARDATRVGAWVHWLILLVGTVGTIFYLRRFGRVQRRAQLAVSAAAFVLWVHAIGGPFARYDWYSQQTASIFLILYTFLIAIHD